MEPTTYGWLVLAFPLAGTLVIALGWRALPGRSAGWIGTGAIALSFLASLGALFQILDLPVEERQLTSSLYTYASAAGLDIEMNVLVDPLSVYMCLIVSGVSMLIHLYSISYLTSDRGYARFFAYLNFFVFSMLLLVLAGNLILLIVGWAFVGFASYALISFWYQRDTAVTAGMKAFVINVVGDIGLVIAALFIFRELGTFDLLAIFEQAPRSFDTNEGVVVLIGLLLLVGAFAKSAQVPLHTWLPDAMEGPTPVSALIHAATMVTAGVYLIARFHPVFEIALTAADIAAFIGLATLLIAATIALVVTDLKRIIAYSTMSQIGYMVVGVSIGAYSAGLFHLMTHAFFKALLFMAAGSVIAAMANRQNIDLMGGFRRAMPFTSAMLLIGALALAAFPVTSGFFSKDEILDFAAYRGGFYWIFAIGGYIGALPHRLLRLPDRLPGGLPASPCPRRGSWSRATSTTPSRPTPLTGEPEDTDVGFPGPEHLDRRARVADEDRDVPARASAPSSPASFRSPASTTSSTSSSHGSFEDSSLLSSRARAPRRPSGGAWRSAARSRSSGSPPPPTVPAGAGHARRRCSGGCPPSTPSSSDKWYFDELIDVLVVRPRWPSGAGPTRPSSATWSRGWSTGPPRSPGAPTPRSAAPSRATCAPTRCCWSPASPASPSTS